ncbi:flagellar basal body protein FliL [Tateyamaria omphalii]|uniref:flagellar basal body-associated FliL family protein n=1 Tax=Tateyamaria omphalii TaxID=299262 RepID=UPI001672215A|nr:flagellar basal body-associated FliL family protein [Tateyamaria omphalii]GGX38317.1 flagellar basal body protein FliL [Tateyamaria omphalii]
MTDTAVDTNEEVKKPSKMPLILGVVALLLGAGGGFFATFSGLILAPESSAQAEPVETSPTDLPDISFVPVEPMVISLAPNAHSRHLRFRAQLEVPSQYASDVESLLPRVVDVLNGYLRALETADIESPAALTRLRAQMLRRVQIVTGPGRVNDLLIMEFVLS